MSAERSAELKNRSRWMGEGVDPAVPDGTAVESLREAYAMSEFGTMASLVADEEAAAMRAQLKERVEYQPTEESLKEGFQDGVRGDLTNPWEYAELYGAVPGASDVDNRPWADVDAMREAYTGFMKKLASATDGHRIGSDTPALLGSVVSSLERRAYVAGKRVKSLNADMEESMRAQNGTEMASLELEQIMGRLGDAVARKDTYDGLQEDCEKLYMSLVGETWTATRNAWGKSDTYAMKQAKQFLQPKDGIPEGTRVVLTGGNAKGFGSEPVFNTLDRVRSKHPDMVLITGGAPGVERWGVEWANSRDVPVVVFEPDWERGRSAPFRRNEAIVQTGGIRGCIAFPGSGVTENLVELLQEQLVPVKRCQLVKVTKQ